MAGQWEKRHEQLHNDPASAYSVVFQLERADNPGFYDDLIRFKKGTKRVNRLRTLAQEGLLAQHWPMGFAGHMMEAKSGAHRVMGATLQSPTKCLMNRSPNSEQAFSINKKPSRKNRNP